MIYNKFLSLMLLIFFTTGSLNKAWSFNESKPLSLPNDILILSDDHIYPYLGCYGHEDLHTPNLDQLASDGTLFTQAYASAYQCIHTFRTKRS